MDITAQRTSQPVIHSTARGSIRLSLGGVALNVSRAAQRHSQAHNSVVLAAPTNSLDPLGRYLRAEMQQRELRQDALLHAEGERTAVCNLLLDEQGNLETGVADMGIVEQTLTPSAVERVFSRWHTQHLAVVAADANMPPETLRKLVQLCTAHDVPFLFEPTSVAKADRLVDGLLQQSCTAQFATPNALELAQMAKRMRSNGWPGESVEAPASLTQALPETAAQLLNDAGVVAQLVNVLFIKLGSAGVLAVCREQRGLHAYHTPAPVLDPSKPINTTGAGDTFTGAILAAIAAIPRKCRPASSWNREELKALIDRGQSAAQQTLYSREAVAECL